MKRLIVGVVVGLAVGASGAPADGGSGLREGEARAALRPGVESIGIWLTPKMGSVPFSVYNCDTTAMRGACNVVLHGTTSTCHGRFEVRKIHRHHETLYKRWAKWLRCG